MIDGIDVSRHQGEIDWQKIADAGILWAAVRCTIGDYYTDETFTRNFDGAKAVGIIPFPYHVLRTDKGDEEQATYFVNALDGRKTWMNVMDVEVVASGDRGRALHYVMREIERKTHAMTTIYTNANFWNTYMPGGFGGSLFNGKTLWVASYGRLNDGNVPGDPYPTLPRTWNSYGAWQYTSRGKIDGIAGWVDKNLMDEELYHNLRMRSGIEEPGGTVPPEPQPPEPPPPDDLELRVFELEKWRGKVKAHSELFPV